MSKGKSSKAKAAEAALTGSKEMSDKTQESQQAPAETVEVKDVLQDQSQGADEQSSASSEQGGADSASQESTPAQDESVDGAQSVPSSAGLEEQTPAAADVVEQELVAEKAAEVPAIEETVVVTPSAEITPEVTPAAAAPAVEENVPPFLYVQRIRLADYVEAMGGKLRISDKEQLDQQNLFRMVIQGLLKLRGRDFVVALDDILSTIQANKHYAFKEKYVFRQYPNLPISPDERRLLVDVVTLLLHIADPATRALVINQIDLSNALKGVRDFDEVHGLFREYITNPSR